MKFKINYKILLFLFSIVLLCIVFLTLLGSKISAQTCACWPPGSTSDQGCAAAGCPAGTRRICNCTTGGTGGACTPVPGCGGTCGGSWSCNCVSDSSCPTGGGTTACTPNAERCNGCDRVRCLSDGTGEVIIGAGACCGGGGGCTATNPNQPVLVSPVDNAVLGSNDVTLNWQGVASWGVGCPANNNVYSVYLDQSCTGSWALLSSTISTTAVANDLNWGSTYCWRVQAHNGSNGVYSSTWRFTVNNPPTVTGNGVIGDMCGYGITGRIDSASTTKSNPLTFTSSFNDIESDTFQEIQIALVPQSSLNTATASSSLVLQSSINSNSVAVRITATTAQTYSASGGVTYSCASAPSPSNPNPCAPGVINPSAPVTCNGNNQVKCETNATTFSWSTPGSGGASITNTANTATVLGSGTITRMTTSGSTANGNIQIEFKNTFPSGLYNIYLMGVTNVGGTLISNNATSSDNLVFARVGTWRFDMVNPTVSIDNIVYAGNSFTARWGASDSSGLKAIYPYIWADNLGSTLVDQTGSYTINPLSNVTLNYPDPSNGGFGISALSGGYSTRTYNYSGETVNYTLKLAAEDLACNIQEGSSGASAPKPWMIGYKGNVSTNGGVTDLSIPSGTTIIESSPGVFQSNIPNKFGSYGVTSGNGILPSTNISEYNTYDYNYYNQATKPESRSGTTDWYNYIKDRVASNNDTEGYTISTGGVVQYPSNYSISTLINSLKGSASNTNTVYYVEYTNPSAIPSFALNTVCDRKVIFVSNAGFRIEPDFTRSTTGACMFVSNGNIQILPTTPQKIDRLLTQLAFHRYDFVEAFVVTNGTLVIPEKTYLSTHRWDGFILKGGAITNQNDFDRNLNSTANALQPALAFRTDPIYSIVFRDALASRYYSIREVLD